LQVPYAIGDTNVGEESEATFGLRVDINYDHDLHFMPIQDFGMFPT